MNPHLSELLSAIGPGLCYGLFGLALFGMRTCFKSFDNVLKKNVQAHDEMMARLNEHDIRLGSHELRIDAFGMNRHEDSGRLDHIENDMRVICERISRLEARDSLLSDKMTGPQPCKKCPGQPL